MLSLLNRKKWVIAGILLLLVVLAAYFYWWLRKDTVNRSVHQELTPVHVTGATRSNYDVIVAGTDPEGITAAVSAARNGLKVLLVDGRNREILGGLMTLGWLNSLDLNKSPKSNPFGKLELLNKGIFKEWYDQMEGTSFDVNTAANAFNAMVAKEKNIDVLLKARKMDPIVEGGLVTGMNIENQDGNLQKIGTKMLIDATQDADMAAAAGVPFTYAREDLGEPNLDMAVTLVFKLSGVTQSIWDSFGRHPKTDHDKMSAWGFRTAKNYRSSNPKRVNIRGLNIGRQNDGTILINSMHIYGVDPLDPKSVQEGVDIGRKEAPRIVEYLKKSYKEFKDLQYAGTAPELYVRESRHILGEYRLKLTDLLDNRDQPDAVAYGSYQVDIQSTGPNDPGAVMMKPQAYGVPFRCLVPLKIDGLLVVGRSASFDSLPHGSARVVPLGMATGEAAGAAAKLAIEKGISMRELSRSGPDMTELRNRLTTQGMNLAMPSFKKPGYAKHPDYPGLKAAASMSLTFGDYNNKGFELDSASNAQRFAFNMRNVKRIHEAKFTGDPLDAVKSLNSPDKAPLSLNQASYTVALSARLKVKPDHALKELQRKGWIRDATVKGIKDPANLTNGEAYMIIRDVMELYAGVKYE